MLTRLRAAGSSPAALGDWLPDLEPGRFSRSAPATAVIGSARLAVATKAEESMQTLLPGITAQRVPTSRLTTAVLSVDGRDGQPVLFVHGNVSSSLFWQPTMLALPEGYRPLA